MPEKGKERHAIAFSNPPVFALLTPSTPATNIVISSPIFPVWLAEMWLIRVFLRGIRRVEAMQELDGNGMMGKTFLVSWLAA